MVKIQPNLSQKKDEVISSAKNAKWPVVALLLIACLSFGFLGGWLGAKQQNSNALSNTSTQQKVVTSESQLISSIAEQVGKSVVSINVTSQGVARSLYGFQRNVEQQSAGTGFIISKDGVVVTNRHVVPESAQSVSVTLADGTELDNVEVIGRTGESDTLDVAFLKIKDSKGKELVPANLGDSSVVKVGDKVIAIGNALGQFQNTVTSGIISGYGRSVTASDGVDSSELANLFQTDASINQGNSGGPLVNMNGEVVGINTAVAGGGAENIGFAIPVNDVKGLITSVLEKGKLERAYLGVRYVSINDEYAYEYNLPVKRGAYLAPPEPGGQPAVIAGSPAEKAGLKEKDIITKVGDTTIDEKTNLTSALSKYQVGDKVELTVLRDGKEQKVTATLEALPTS